MTWTPGPDLADESKWPHKIRPGNDVMKLIVFVSDKEAKQAVVFAHWLTFLVWSNI